tara:strand:- start:1600 stop:2277 length:678 start_codon:yes stop_codon:yes gene_type:complete
MAINSQEVAYQFGQHGSAITDSTSELLHPPKGLVIVSITALAETKFTTLSADSNYTFDTGDITNGPKNIFANTDNSAHGFGELTRTNGNQFTGHNDNGSNDTGKITLNAASPLIKPGMIVESETLCPRDLDNPYVVQSHNGATTNQGLLIEKRKSTGTLAAVAGDLASGAAETLAFYANDGGVSGQGKGGLTMNTNDTLPTGVTIYGRYEALKLSTGRVIVYFGR